MAQPAMRGDITSQSWDRSWAEAGAKRSPAQQLPPERETSGDDKIADSVFNVQVFGGTIAHI
jgi:hypothetical protein